MSESPAATLQNGAQHGPKHQYHLVDPSIWPLVGALSAGALAVGAVLYMHGHGTLLLTIAFVAVLAMMAAWWRDVIKEATFQGHHTPVVQLGMRYGMALFIASEVMFFAAFFWAFFDASLFPKEATGGVWPPKGVHPFNAFELPFLNSMSLLLGLGLTVLLGLSFTGVQAYEYSHAAFTFKDGIYPSTFFMATGFHGFHVIIGTTFLIVCFFRAKAGHFKPDHHFGFEAAAWYWHFVDVVWLFLFICVYWWGGGSATGAE